MRKLNFKKCFFILFLLASYLTAHSETVDDESFFFFSAESFVHFWPEQDSKSNWPDGRVPSFDPSTKTLVTGLYGSYGWLYEEGIDLSEYKYLVAELEEPQTCGGQFRLYGDANFWTPSAGYNFEGNTQVVVDLKNVKYSEGDWNGEPLDVSSVYRIAFWSYGGCPIKIKRVFLTNSDDYKPAIQYPTLEMKVAGTNRILEYYAPEDLPENRPLILLFHGMGMWYKGMIEGSKHVLIADTAKYVVVAPNGIDGSWDVGGGNDVQFVSDIIDKMYDMFKIDKSRVYATGFSWGGNFSYRLAKDLSDKIAAIAGIMGHSWGPNISNGQEFVGNCSHPMPILQFSGFYDDVYKMEYVQNILNKWIEFNDCSTDENKIVRINPYPKNASGSDITIWKNENTGIEVAWLKSPHGHSIPVDLNGVFASKEIWNYCSRYSLDGLIDGPSTNLSNTPIKDDVDVFEKEYYTLTGEKTGRTDQQLKGVFILKKIMSDKSVEFEKVLLR